MTDGNASLKAEVKAKVPLRRLALSLGVSRQAVSQWFAKGRIPAKRVIEVEKVTGISRHRLDPDIYPENENQ